MKKIGIILFIILALFITTKNTVFSNAKNIDVNTKTNSNIHDKNVDTNPDQTKNDVKKDLDSDDNTGQQDDVKDNSKTDNNVNQITKVNEKKNPVWALLNLNLDVAFGIFSPISAYGEKFNYSPAISLFSTYNNISIFGFSPVILFSYNKMETKDDPNYYRSTMSLTQFGAGIKYSHNFNLPSFISKFEFFKKPVTLSAGIYDGITQVEFNSKEQGRYVEYINTIDLGAGFSYPMIWNIEFGFNFGYRIIFTAVEPLQGLFYRFTFGVRI